MIGKLIQNAKAYYARKKMEIMDMTLGQQADAFAVAQGVLAGVVAVVGLLQIALAWRFFTGAVLLLLAGGIGYAAHRAWCITRKEILPGMTEVSETLMALSQGQGNLSDRLDDRGFTEVGELVQWFNMFLAGFQGVMGQVASNALELATSSQQLSGAAGELTTCSNETDEQSKSVAGSAVELSGNMNDLSSNAEKMSSNVRSVAAAITELTSSVEEIAEQTTTASELAKEAAGFVQTSEGIVSELGTASVEIGRVLAMIKDIAFQTNLLALNAAIEAARAGRAGKGFAVVASEVRTLADKTTEAAEGISERVSGIQTAADDAVNAIHRIDGVVGNLDSISVGIASAIDQQSTVSKSISENIYLTSEAAVEVAEKVAASAQMSDSISESMGSVHEAAQKTATGADMSHQSGERMAELSSELKELTVTFQIE